MVLENIPIEQRQTRPRVLRAAVRCVRAIFPLNAGSYINEYYRVRLGLAKCGECGEEQHLVALHPKDEAKGRVCGRCYRWLAQLVGVCGQCGDKKALRY